MKISVIIPTLNRPIEIENCLKAIKRNTRQPDEVVIVEQGDIDVTEKVLRICGVDARAVHLKTKSLTVARNTGLGHITGDVVVFIDDDVVVADNYLQTVEHYFSKTKNVDVLGIVGLDLVYAEKSKTPKDFVRQVFGVLFWRSTLGNSSRVLLSGHNILRNTTDQEQSIEWISGATSAWRREVFDNFSFDKRMIRWCFGEDVSLSYKIHSAFPDSLRYVPNLKYQHNVSSSGRLLNEQLIKMMVIYRYIFWREQIKSKSHLSTLAYLWSQVGFVILEISTKRSLGVLPAIFDSYIFLHRYIKKQKTINSFEELNKFILGI